MRATELQGPVLQRKLTIANQEVGSARITQHSAYKTRLNSVISEEAAKVRLAPYKVRQQLVRMAEGDANYRFPTMRGAVRAALIPLANFRAAMLSQEAIVTELEKWFGGDRARLHEASKTPEFAEGLLEQIRQKQSQTWIKATTIRQVPKTEWRNQELQYWNVRHYTNKFMVVLGEPDAEGTFAVAGVEPPPFTDLLSSITLATMSRTGGTTKAAHKRGDKVMMTFTSGASTSGHTTGLDWRNIGNVGDTFYGLFYKDKPASGLTPAFIKDAVYYAMWPVSEFGTAWASADWLASAAESQTEGGKTPGGEARQGELADIVADIFPGAATRDFSATGGKEARESKENRKLTFQAMENFEVKKHGSMTVKKWLPRDENIERIKEWRVNPTTGEVKKLHTVIRSNVVGDTSGYALLKAARRLNLLGPREQVDKDIYKFGDQTFKGESELADKLATDGELFARLTRAVDEKSPEPAAMATPVAPVAPPPPPGEFGAGKKRSVTGDKNATVAIGGQ